jgi:hypothetical protein
LTPYTSTAFDRKGLRMLATVQRRKRAGESRLLAMADRVFDDFDYLPVKVVFDALSAARRTLRLEETPATPEEIERLARARLTTMRVA